MSEHVAIIEWTSSATAADYVKGRYSRAHTWQFDGGVTVAGSPAPANVPAPWSDPAGVDPEEAFVAAVSSCHMLTFLYLAAKAGLAVASYRDEAVGVMTRGEGGVPWISTIRLAPRIAFAERAPSPAELAELHHAAHDGCFIARSIKTDVIVT